MSWIGSNYHIDRSKQLLCTFSLFVFISTFFIGASLINQYESLIREEKRHFLNNELIVRANTLVQSINYRISLLYGVKAFVTANTELFKNNPQEFEQKANLFLKALHQHAPNVSSIAISPDGIHKYVFPVTDRALNSIGHNLLSDKRPHVRAKVQETINSRMIGISGPYALRDDGGLGLIARLGIYLDDDSFWGLTTVVFDIPQFLAEANLQNLNNRAFQFSLRVKGGDVFYGSALDFEKNSLLYEIDLPDGQWELTLKSSEGLDKLKFVIPLFVINFLIAFLLSLLLFTLLSRKKNLELEINKAITKEKLSQGALEAVFQALPDLYFRMSKDGTILDYRAKNIDDLYISPKDFLNFKMQEVLPPNEGKFFVEKIAQHLQTNELQTFEYSLTLPRGNCIYEARLTSLSDTDELIMVAREITERKKIEESMQLASTVYTNSSEGMVVTDNNNRIIAINPAFSKITGYKEEDVLGKDLTILNSSKQSKRLDESIQESINATGQWHGEVWRQRKNGESYIERLTINTIYNEEGLVHQQVALFSDITEKKNAEELILHQANYDSLTQLPNRRMLCDRLDQEIKKSHRAKLPLALLFIDLDWFKEVNDSLGHDIGDILLIESAKRILACVRDSDTVARFGGDEFTVILSELGDTHSIERIAQSIIQELSKPFSLANNLVTVSASIGISLFPDDARDVNELQKIADQAMYLAKELGRSRFSYFTKSMQQAAQIRINLLHDMSIALDEGQFQLYYQPIVCLNSKKIYKAEALLRWNHPKDGMINPVDFIPLAEESGLIIDIGNWVFKEAIRQVNYFKEKYGFDIQISINKSPIQFQSTNDHNKWMGWMFYKNLTYPVMV